jgi:hypothetical protein
VDTKSYRQALEDSGFRVEQEHNRREFALQNMDRVMARMAQAESPIVGLQLLMGEKAPAIAKNLLSLMKDGTLAPIEMFCRAV